MRATLLAGLLALSACAVSPDPATIEARPPDFSVAAAVLAPSEGAPGPRPPRSLRPGRYIVDCDGVLRASVGAGSGPATFPAQTRQLTHAQMERLWDLTRESALFGPDSGAHIDNPAWADPDPSRSIAVLEASFLGKRAAVRVPLDRDSAEAIAAEEIVDTLADLAWVRE